MRSLMKCIGLLVLAGGVCIGTLVSADEVMYVNAAKSVLKKEPKMDASSVGDLERGDELSVQKKEGMWYQVKKGGKVGWVPKLFISSTKPVGAATLATDVKNDFKASRERTTPRSVVASTRGLDASKSMSRVREGGLMYRVDYRSVDDIEKMKIENEDLAAFKKQGESP